MAASSHVFQSKRGRDEYWDSGLASPNAKRTNTGTLGYDSDLIALIEKIDNTDNNEDTDAVNEVEDEIMLNEIIKSLEDEIGLKEQTDDNFESTDEKGSTDQMGSNKQGKLTAEANFEATLVTSDIADFTYQDNVLTDHITPDEFRIMMQNYLDRDSVPDTMYSDTVHGFIESREASYGSLWGDDIWLLNEYPVIQNDFTSPQQEEFKITAAKFHDVWN